MLGSVIALIGFGILAIIFGIVVVVSTSIRSSSKELSCGSELNGNNGYCVRVVKEWNMFYSKKYFTVGQKDSPRAYRIGYPELDSTEINSDDNIDWNISGVKLTTPIGYELQINKGLYQNNW
jgi:hypothetical protein